MIRFGKTDEERLALKTKAYQKEQERRRRLMNGVKKFAWFPIKINTGEYVWLATYYQYYSAHSLYKGNIVLTTDSRNKPIVRNYLDRNSEYIGTIGI